MLKRILKVLFAATLIAAVSFVVWALWIPQPMHEALIGSISRERVEVRTEPSLSFTPKAGSRRLGLILYPGARVDPRAYAPLGQLLAEDGITVVIPSMTLNMAILSPGKAQTVLDQTDGVDTWFIAGHSLGGTMAADFAEQNIGQIFGLILLASYPLASSGLAETKLPVLSIYGNKDSIATVAEVTGARSVLPPVTRWLEIDGGNHSQFGWYGDQNGDGIATISRQEQQSKIANSIIEFINAANGQPRPISGAILPRSSRRQLNWKGRDPIDAPPS